MKTLVWTLTGLALLPFTARSQEPSEEPREKSKYHVRAEVGPWMVLAATYRGPDALSLAEQHVKELRLTYRLPGHTIALDEIKDRWNKNNGKWVTVSPRAHERRHTRTYKEWGVLVGGYKDRDTALQALAYLRQRVGPPKLKDSLGRPVKSTLHVWERPDLKNPDKVKLKEKKESNPYKTAFVIRNPMLPPLPAPDKSKPDPLWIKLNAGEEYSLLDCDAKWTLAIMELQGVAVVDQSFTGSLLEKIGFTDRSQKLLNANAAQANEMAKFLRKYGMKAYVLHTRSSSIVTVGEFDSPKSPELTRLQQQMSNFRLRGATVPLPLFKQPMPMKVPKY